MSEVKKWQRPESVPVPTVWATYESKKPMANGRTPRFRIQDFTEEWTDHVVYNMINFFMRDEVLCKSFNLREDEEAVEDYKTLLHEFLGRKMGLVAIVENLEELGDENLPILAGCNITGIITRGEKSEKKGKSENFHKILEAMEEIEHKNDPFKHYGVSEYMYAFGLSVDPAYRGHGLGYEILKARFPLCKAVGIKATVTVFTGAAAQRSAEKAGFETIAEIIYDDYKDKDGQIVFRVKEPKSMKLMGVRIPS